MESSREPSQGMPTAGEAAWQLHSLEQLRKRVETQNPSRAFALLQLGSAIVLSVYVGVFLLSFGSRPPEGTVADGYQYTSMILLPILMFSSLVIGARERFKVRKKPTIQSWVGSVVVLGSFMGLVVLTIIGASYPWWLNLLVPVAMFVTMGAGPLRRLRLSRTSDSVHWVTARLSRPARWTTGSIGAAAGLLAASGGQQMWFAVTSLGVMGALLVVLIGWQATWGLPRTGYEWAPIHWAAFGLTMTILFGLGVILSRTDWITIPVSVGAGVFIVAIMLTASFLPAQSQRR